jgi:cytoskeleton protein RodZ
MSFGANLKRERESRGISLQQISDRTKIGVRLLKALEEERFEQLPGGIFDKSFLRQYARFLDMNEDQLISDYMRASGATPEAASTQHAPVETTATTSHANAYARLILLAIAVGVVVAGIVYGVRQLIEYRSRSRSASQVQPITESRQQPSSVTYSSASVPTPTDPPATPIAAADSGAVRPTSAALPASAALDVRSSVPVAPAPALQQPVPPPNPASGTPLAAAPIGSTLAPRADLIIEIAARKEVWVAITTDGKKEWQGNMSAERTRRVEAKDSVQLTVGDAGAVGVSLNGKPLPSLGRAGEVKTLTITSKGLAQAAQ